MIGKLKVIFLILMGLGFYICFESYGTNSATVFLQASQNTVQKGEIIGTTFGIKEQKTASYLATIYFDETKVEWVSGPENVIVDNNQVKILWYDNQGGNAAKQGSLGNLTWKAKEEGLANFVIEGEFYSEKGDLIQTSFENLQVQIGKEQSKIEAEQVEQRSNPQTDNANLQSLSLDVEGIVPNFDKDIYEYDISLSIDKNDLEVLAVSENPKAQVEIIGNLGMKEGSNTIKIKVTSEDKSQTKEYRIQVTKTNHIELANTNLEILAIEGETLNPAFNTHVLQYNTEISNEKTTLNIFAVPENEQGKVEIIGNSNLKEGDNIIKIKVTAANRITTREYQVNVYKRNLEEEQIYREEQKHLQEKLEQAYEIQKVSTLTNEETKTQEQQQQEQNKKFGWIAVIVGIMVVGIMVGAIYYKRKKKFKFSAKF